MLSALLRSGEIKNYTPLVRWRMASGISCLYGRGIIEPVAPMQQAKFNRRVALNALNQANRLFKQTDEAVNNVAFDHH